MARPLQISNTDIAETEWEDVSQPSRDLMRVLEEVERTVLPRKGPSRQPTPVGRRVVLRPFAYD